MDWTQIIITAIPVIGSIVTVILTSMTRKTAEKTQAEAKRTQEDTKRTKEAVEKTTAAVTDLMRNEITKLYYKRQDVGELYEHERQSLDKMYKGYHAAGGNSFVDDIYAEMRTWKVIGSGKMIGEVKQ